MNEEFTKNKIIDLNILKNFINEININDILNIEISEGEYVIRIKIEVLIG